MTITGAKRIRELLGYVMSIAEFKSLLLAVLESQLRRTEKLGDSARVATARRRFPCKAD